jgi:hypothetical protein
MTLPGYLDWRFGPQGEEVTSLCLLICHQARVLFLLLYPSDGSA